MKKVRAYITVDLNVGDNLTLEEVKSLTAVGKYQCSPKGRGNDKILLKDSDFEVEDYVDIEINDREEAK